MSDPVNPSPRFSPRPGGAWKTPDKKKSAPEQLLEQSPNGAAHDARPLSTRSLSTSETSSSGSPTEPPQDSSSLDSTRFKSLSRDLTPKASLPRRSLAQPQQSTRKKALSAQPHGQNTAARTAPQSSGQVAKTVLDPKLMADKKKHAALLQNLKRLRADPLFREGLKNALHGAFSQNYTFRQDARGSQLIPDHINERHASKVMLAQRDEEIRASNELWKELDSGKPLDDDLLRRAVLLLRERLTPLKAVTTRKETQQGRSPHEALTSKLAESIRGAYVAKEMKKRNPQERVEVGANVGLHAVEGMLLWLDMMEKIDEKHLGGLNPVERAEIVELLPLSGTEVPQGE